MHSPGIALLLALAALNVPDTTTVGETMTTTAPVATGTSADRTSRVRRDAGRVWIEQARGFGFHERVSSVHSAQAAILAYLGESIGYDELVGHSALAFRVQVHPEFCPSSPHPCCGFRCVENDSDPWQRAHYDTAALKPETPEQVQRIAEVRQAVRASIDRGIPVHYGDIEDGVIVGYQADGAEWLCFHPLHDRAGKLHVERSLSWGVVVYERPRAVPMSRHDRARRALAQAITMWTTAPNPAPAGGGYYVGDAAWGFWIDELEKLTDATPETAGKIQHGNAWIYDALTACRRSAGKYLRLIADEFEPAERAHLLRAAALYEEMADTVLSDAEHCVVTIAPYVNDKPWTSAQRAEQLRRMRLARELDRQAIESIGEAIGR